MLTGTAVVFDNRHTIFCFCAIQYHPYAFMKCYGCVIGCGSNGFQLFTSVLDCIIYKMLVKPASQASAFMRITYAYQMDICDRRSLRNETEQIGNHSVIFFNNISGIAKLIKKNGMMKSQGSVISPEFCNLGNNLIKVTLCQIEKLAIHSKKLNRKKLILRTVIAVTCTRRVA